MKAAGDVDASTSMLKKVADVLTAQQLNEAASRSDEEFERSVADK